MTETAAPPADTPALRQQILQTCLDLCEAGFFIGTWGNISVRVREGMLVTPSRVDYQTQTLDDLVLVDWDGTKRKGERLPSSEAEMHRILLLRRPEMGCFLHIHSPLASAFAVAHRAIPACVEDMAHILGGETRCAPYTEGGRNTALGEAAAEAMGNRSAAVLLANHGAVVGGRDLEEAVVAAQVLEKGAAIVLHAEALGGVQPLPPELVNAERDKFLYKYGKE